MTRDVIHVVAGVIRRKAGGPILLTRRPPGVHLGGLWEFPGGKLGAGESPKAGLAREIREELGARVEVGALVGERTHTYPERTVRLSLYECRLTSSPRAPEDPDARAWCRPEDLARYPMPEANGPLVAVLTRTAGQPPPARRRRSSSSR